MLLAEVDENNDGVVDFGEFLGMMRKLIEKRGSGDSAVGAMKLKKLDACEVMLMRAEQLVGAPLLGTEPSDAAAGGSAGLATASEASELRHNCQHAILPQQCRFAAHVGTRQQKQSRGIDADPAANACKASVRSSEFCGSLRIDHARSCASLCACVFVFVCVCVCLCVSVPKIA